MRCPILHSPSSDVFPQVGHVASHGEPRGWKPNSITDRKVEAEHSGYRVIVKSESVILEGLTPQEILEKQEEGYKSELVRGVLLLLGGGS